MVTGSIAVKSSVTMESHPVLLVNVYGPYTPPTVVILPSGNVYSSPLQKLSDILFTSEVSFTVIVTVTEAELPQSSVAFQVHITVIGSPLGPSTVPIAVPPGLQLSVYSNSGIGGISPTQFTVISSGTEGNSGGVISTVLVMS